MDIESLIDYGVDWDKGLKNCIGDMNFYKKILSMFLEDQCFYHAKEAYLKGDKKEFFTRMHELKGISGNIALTELYDTTVPIVEMLRFKKEECNKEELDRLYAAFEAAYNRACEGINLFIGNK